MDFRDKTKLYGQGKVESVAPEELWQGMSFSDQAIGALMLALQKCLIEQSDITGILRGLKLSRHMDTNQIHVLNPPTFTVDIPDEAEEE